MQIERTDNFIASLGVEAYRVGGSVRDELLGRRPKDADYMIRGVDLDHLHGLLAAHLVIAGYTEKRDIGPLEDRDRQQFGLRVSARGLGSIEIAVPRREEHTGIGRKQRIVADPSLPVHEDAKRRDFTFNALYKRLVGTANNYVITDPTSRGLYDLQHKLVQTTHRDSFRDDPLRTLRALRFVSTLGYDLTADTHEQMVEYAECVTGLNASGYASGTVMQEMSKILMGDDVAKALRLARDTGVLAVLFPELAAMLGFDQGSRYHDLTTDEHTFKALETAAHVEAPLRVRWALLFHDSGKPKSAWVGDDGRKHYYASLRGAEPYGTVQTEDHEVVGERLWREAAQRLGATRELREDVALLIREHMVPTRTKAPVVRARRMRVKFGDSMLHDLLLHRVCDLSGKGVKVALNQIEHVAKLERIRAEAQTAQVPCRTKDLAINGYDVMKHVKDGRAVGALLERVLDEVVCDPSPLKLSREWQLQRAEALA